MKSSNVTAFSAPARLTDAMVAASTALHTERRFVGEHVSPAMSANLITRLQCILALLQEASVIHSSARGIILSSLGVAAGVVA